MKSIIALAIAALVSSSAMADTTVTNTNKEYSVKVQYRLPGKTYGLSTESYGVGYDTPTATVYPFEEALVEVGKSAKIPGKIVKTIVMVPGPDVEWLFKMSSAG